MISTVAQVQNRTLALLDDSAGATFTTAIYTEGFSEAWDAMRAAMVQYQIPFIEEIVEVTISPGVTSLSPSTAGIGGFGELVELEERRAGSTDRYIRIEETDKLQQRDPGEVLGEFVWRLDTFQFIGATTSRQIRIRYWDTGAAPTSGTTGVDGAITFLSKYAASVMAPRKGYDEYAARYKLEAVGGRYEEGLIGGALFRLIQPMVRSRQRVQVAPKPYGVIRRRAWRRSPYIAANQPSGGGHMPAIFKSSDFSLAGLADGSNPTFYLGYPVSRVIVHLNGIALTEGSQFTHGANVITFLDPFIPQPGADIMIEGWL